MGVSVIREFMSGKDTWVFGKIVLSIEYRVVKCRSKPVSRKIQDLSACEAPDSVRFQGTILRWSR